MDKDSKELSLQSFTPYEINSLLERGVITKVRGVFLIPLKNLPNSIPSSTPELISWGEEHKIFQNSLPPSFINHLISEGVILRVEGGLKVIRRDFEVPELKEGFYPLTRLGELKKLVKKGLCKIKVGHKFFYTGEETARIPSFFKGKENFRSLFHKYRDKAIRYLQSIGLKMYSDPGFETTSFDVFESLLIPQFHPAMEMQGILKIQGEGKELDENLVKKVSQIHSGPLGEGLDYQYTEGEGKPMLRSHLTHISIKEVSKGNSGVFSILPVFRNEKEDSTHLCDFNQIEIAIPGRNLSQLKTFMKDFYGHFGLEVFFEVSYFPYTDPSIEVYASFKDGTSCEVGGGGIFTKTLCRLHNLEYPTMAMGLGFERLIMICEGLNSLKDIF